MSGRAGEPAVRSCLPGDLDAVAGIYDPYVLHGLATFDEVAPEPAEWRRRLDAAGASGLPFLVAESAGRVLGYAYCAPWKPRSAYRHTVEDSVYVAADATGRGVGARLLDVLLAESERAGVRQVIAVIAAGDCAASVALHRRFGFEQVGRLSAVGFKFGRHVDTILMQRSLVAAAV